MSLSGSHLQKTKLTMKGGKIMATYTPRLSEPSTTDKNWIHYTAGGYNYCITINGTTSVLPNCTGYAWGRWRELLGTYHNLSRNNANSWFGNTSDGYQRGSTPKLGAVACWAGKNGSAGHVGIVEKIDSNGTITVSNSGFGNKRFFISTHAKPYHSSSEGSFQGFIYFPKEFDDRGPDPVNGTYQSHDATYGWNPNVKFNDVKEYAGNYGINLDAIYLDYYSLRVHDMVKNEWLPWVKARNDYAGNIGHAIDAIQSNCYMYEV